MLLSVNGFFTWMFVVVVVVFVAVVVIKCFMIGVNV